MKKTTKAVLAAAALTLGTMTTAFAAAATPSLGAVRQAAQSAANAPTIIATLEGNTVTLSGSVQDGIEKLAAVDAVSGVPGVNQVIDHVSTYN